MLSPINEQRETITSDRKSLFFSDNAWKIFSKQPSLLALFQVLSILKHYQSKKRNHSWFSLKLKQNPIRK